MRLQEGSVRSKQETIRQLEAQLDTVLNGYTSKLDNLQRESGVIKSVLLLFSRDAYAVVA